MLATSRPLRGVGVTDSCICNRQTRYGSHPVASVSFSPDGQTVASGSWDKTVRIFNLEDGTCQKVLEGHRYRLNAALGKSVIGETGAGYSQCPVFTGHWA